MPGSFLGDTRFLVGCFFGVDGAMDRGSFTSRLFGSSLRDSFLSLQQVVSEIRASVLSPGLQVQTTQRVGQVASQVDKS